MNYIGSFSTRLPDHKITDCSDIASGDYLVNMWIDNNSKLYVCYLQVVLRTKKFITITDKDQFIKLSWNEKDKYWGKNQGYQCRYYINQDEFPEGLETMDTLP